MEPVTAKLCLRGTPEMLLKRAYNSAQVALSPSTISYNCSKVIEAEKLIGFFLAYVLPIKLVIIR